MFRRFSLATLASLAGLGCANSLLASSVGTGPDSVDVVFNFPDGFVADYDAHFGTSPTSTISGYDATQLAAADSNLVLDWVNFAKPADPPNFFLNTATYASVHIGDGSVFDPNQPENFWHEWIDTGSGWVFGGGASADILSTTNKIGWVFGTDNTPVPEPTTFVLAITGSAMLFARRRKLSCK